MTVNALLVGGPADIRRDQEAHLEPEGVCVLDHWTYDKKRGGAVSHRLPKRTQLVVLVRDMMGHRHSLEVVKLAKRQGVPVVYGTRKWSETRPLIIAALAKLPHAAAPEAPEPVSEWDVLDQEVAEQEPLPKSPELIAADAAQCAAVDLLLTAIELALVAPKTDSASPTRRWSRGRSARLDRADLRHHRGASQRSALRRNLGPQGPVQRPVTRTASTPLHPQQHRRTAADNSRATEDDPQAIP